MQNKSVLARKQVYDIKTFIDKKFFKKSIKYELKTNKDQKIEHSYCFC